MRGMIDDRWPWATTASSSPAESQACRCSDAARPYARARPQPDDHQRTALARPEIFREAVESGLEHIHVSLHSYRPEVHDFITRSGGLRVLVEPSRWSPRWASARTSIV